MSELLQNDVSNVSYEITLQIMLLADFVRSHILDNCT